MYYFDDVGQRKFLAIFLTLLYKSICQNFDFLILSINNSNELSFNIFFILVFYFSLAWGSPKTNSFTFVSSLHIETSSGIIFSRHSKKYQFMT